MPHSLRHRSTTYRFVFGLLASLLCLTALYGYLTCFRQALIDDAYITFQFAKTLAEEGRWGLYPEATVNTATSPLNVILTAAMTLLTRDAVEAGILLATVELYLLLIVLLKMSHRLFRNAYFGALAFCALLFNPLLMSTIGLESLLFVLLAIASVAAWNAQKPIPLQALLLALLALTRPDGLLLAPVIVLLTPTWRARLRLAILVTLFLLPWALFAWIGLGSLLPDTLFIKKMQTGWGVGFSLQFGNGLLSHFAKFPLQTIASFALVPGAILLVLRARRRVRRVALALLLFTVGHYAAYSILGVPPYHWYYTATVMGTALLAALGIANLYAWIRPRRSLAWRAAFLIPFLIACTGLVWKVCDERRLVFNEAPIHTNWSTCARYREIAEWLNVNVPQAEDIDLGGEIGTVAYYCDRRLWNEFSCREWFDDYFALQQTKHPLRQLLYRVNFFWLSREHESLPSRHLRLTWGTRAKPSGHTVDADGSPLPAPTRVMTWRLAPTEWIPWSTVTLETALKMKSDEADHRSQTLREMGFVDEEGALRISLRKIEEFEAGRGHR